MYTSKYCLEFGFLPQLHWLFETIIRSIPTWILDGNADNLIWLDKFLRSLFSLAIPLKNGLSHHHLTMLIGNPIPIQLSQHSSNNHKVVLISTLCQRGQRAHSARLLCFPGRCLFSFAIPQNEQNCWAQNNLEQHFLVILVMMRSYKYMKLREMCSQFVNPNHPVFKVRF